MPFFYYKPVMCFQYEIKNYEITKQLLSKFLQSLSTYTKLWIENGTFLNVKFMSVNFFMYMPLSMFRNSNCIENVKFYHLWMAYFLTPFNTIDCLFMIILILVFNLKFFLVSDSVYYSVQEAAFMFTWPPQLCMYWNLVHEWQ